MGNPAKEKGSRWERAIVEYLRANGFPYAERTYGAGRPADVGDIDGLPGVVVEAKDHARHDFAGWLDEARREQANARAQYGVVVAKRRGRPVGDAYAVMTFDTLVRLLSEREALL